MITFDFTKPGKYPFTQDTLKEMQAYYQQLAQAYVNSHGDLSGGNYIISGAEVDGSNNVTAGWAVVDGELLNIVGGTGTHLALVEDITSVTYQDNSVEPSIKDRYLEPTNTATGNTLISDFERISLVPQNAQETIELTQTGVGNFDVTFLKIGNIVFVTIENGWEVATGARFTAIPTKYRPSADRFIAISYRSTGDPNYTSSSRLVVNTAGEMYVETPSNSEVIDKDFTFSYML